MGARPAASVRSVRRAAAKLFLNVDNHFGAFELLLQALVLAAEVRIFECERIGFTPALFRSESIQDALCALAPPRREMR